MSAEIRLEGKVIGIAGLLTEALKHKWRITSPVAVLEVQRDVFLANAFRSPSAKNVPVYPATSRDIALIADGKVTHAQIVETIRKAAPKELVNVTLFDIFKGKSIGAGRQSMAYSLEYRSPERTLRDEEVNAFHDKIKAALKTGLGVEIREG